MITRSRILVFLVFIGLIPNACTIAQDDFRFQEPHVIQRCEEVVLDADSLPYKTEWLTNGKLDNVKYIRQNGDAVEATFLITDAPKYSGGFDSLKSFFAKNFRSPQKIETNGKVKVSFIFNESELEVRILQRLGISGDHKAYDHEVQRVLLLTKNRWNLKSLKGTYPFVFEYYFSVP